MQRFLHIVQPTKWRNRFVEGAYGAKFITGRERIVSIEPDGIEDVFALQTTTRNYIVWGLASSNSAGQLQQRPSPRGGGAFQVEKITIVDAVPAEAQMQRVRRWDLASTVATPGKDPDWTVGVRMGKDQFGRLYIDDVRRFRAGPAEVEQAILATASVDGTATRLILPQDPGQAGKSQIKYFVTRFAPYAVESVLETGDKVDRARSLVAQVEVGNLYLLRGKWNEPFLKELADFPNGSHDDQVDAAVGAFIALMGGSDAMIEWMRRQMEAIGE
jgi:predicted phage terminase large subunit-like protein